MDAKNNKMAARPGVVMALSVAFIVCVSCESVQTGSSNPYNDNDRCIAIYEQRLTQAFQEVEFSSKRHEALARIIASLPEAERSAILFAAKVVTEKLQRVPTDDDYSEVHGQLPNAFLDAFEENNICKIDHSFVNGEYFFNQLNQSLIGKGVDTELMFSPPGQELVGRDLQRAMMTWIVIEAAKGWL
jgi:hypothetical protein